MGKATYNKLIVNQFNLFVNPPEADNGQPLHLPGNFELLEPLFLRKWIDHLAMSFAQNCPLDKPFRFLSKRSRKPVLNFIIDNKVSDVAVSDVDGKPARTDSPKRRRGRPAKQRNSPPPTDQSDSSEDEQKDTSKVIQTKSEQPGKRHTRPPAPKRAARMKSKATIESNEDDEDDANRMVSKIPDHRSLSPVKIPTRPGHPKRNAPPRDATALEVHPTVSSVCFQSPLMDSTTTLPIGWRHYSWDAKKVLLTSKHNLC